MDRRSFLVAGLAGVVPGRAYADRIDLEDNCQLPTVAMATNTVELCHAVGDQLAAPDADPLRFLYRVRIYEYAGVDPRRDSRSHAAKKVQHWWSLVAPRLVCQQLGFSVRDGHVLKLAVEKNSKDFMNDAVRRWGIDLNVMDRTGGTVMDYIEGELAAGRGHPLLYNPHFELLRRFGARKAAELASAPRRIDPFDLEIAPRLTTWERACYSSEGLQAVRRGGQWGYIDPNGVAVIPPIYDGAFCFSEGRAAVHRGGLWGYIDTSGAEVIPPRYRDAAVFNGGRAEVSSDGLNRLMIGPQGQRL